MCTVPNMDFDTFGYRLITEVYAPDTFINSLPFRVSTSKSRGFGSEFPRTYETVGLNPQQTKEPPLTRMTLGDHIRSLGGRLLASSTTGKPGKQEYSVVSDKWFVPDSS